MERLKAEKNGNFLKAATNAAINNVIEFIKNPKAHLESEDAMLILVRKVRQGIWIEGDILIKVLGVEGDRVKLGISAPGDVKVLRSELVVSTEPEEMQKPPENR